MKRSAFCSNKSRARLTKKELRGPPLLSLLFSSSLLLLLTLSSSSSTILFLLVVLSALVSISSMRTLGKQKEHGPMTSFFLLPITATSSAPIFGASSVSYNTHKPVDKRRRGRRRRQQHQLAN